jgi:redox-regulated HSP33 family molecular chaperone
MKDLIEKQLGKNVITFAMLSFCLKEDGAIELKLKHNGDEFGLATEQLVKMFSEIMDEQQFFGGLNDKSERH